MESSETEKKDKRKKGRRKEEIVEMKGEDTEKKRNREEREKGIQKNKKKINAGKDRVRDSLHKYAEKARLSSTEICLIENNKKMRVKRCYVSYIHIRVPYVSAYVCEYVQLANIRV